MSNNFTVTPGGGLNVSTYTSGTTTTFIDTLKLRDKSGYIKSEDFFELLKSNFDATYGGSDTEWHPEDLYVNLLVVLEVMCNTLTNNMNLRNGRTVRSIKEI